MRTTGKKRLSYSSPDLDSDHGGFWGSILDLIPGGHSIQILSLIYVPVWYIQWKSYGLPHLENKSVCYPQWRETQNR